MSENKYIGMDVHQGSTVVSVRDESGKVVIQSILETEGGTLLQFLHGLSGTLHVAFEEGVSAQWLHDLLVRQVARVVVCDPRKIAASVKKNDQVDARKLGELLRAGQLSAVYHGESGLHLLKELAGSYLALSKDTTRVMNRLKSVYRSRAIRCAGQRVYSEGEREAWLEKLPARGARQRAERPYEQLDFLQPLRREARQELVTESQKHSVAARLREIPSWGRCESPS